MTRRIALFLPSLNGGGAERVAIFVGTYLERHGYAVDLVAANGVGALADDPFVQRHLVDLKCPAELLALRRWCAYLKRVRPDAAISLVHSANFLSGIGAWLVPQVPVIVAIHNTLIKQPAHQWWARRFFGFGPERILYRRAALVQTVSQELAEQAHRLFAIPRDKLVNTYNSVDLPPPDQPVLPADLAEIERLGRYIVSVGRLIPIKGFDLLIAAFAKAQIPSDFRLVILGDGPERERLQAQIDASGLGDRITLAGFRDPVAPWLRHAQGFVLATHGEGFGLVVLEALLAGLPVAAARVPGVVELMDDGRIGRLFEVGDLPAITAAIEDIAIGSLAPPDCNALSTHAAKFDPEAVGQRYLRMIERVLDSDQGR